MKIFYVTQGASVHVFYNLHQEMAKKAEIEACGWFVTDQQNFYASFEKPEETLPGTLLKEWEIFEEALGSLSHNTDVSRWEAQFDIPSLWPVVIADRRVIDGPYCKVTQDYKSQYTHATMRAIVNSFAQAFDAVLKQGRPDLILSFGPNTLGARLMGLIAKSMGIPFLTLKSTKISNYVTWSETDNETHPRIAKNFEAIMNGRGVHDDVSHYVDSYLSAIENSENIQYEGITKLHKARFFASLQAYMKMLPSALYREIKYLRNFDPQVIPPLGRAWFESLGRYRYQKAASAIIRPFLFDPAVKDNPDYVFFPLNSEPEIAVNVFSYAYRNQIEVIRNIAQSLPMDMVVVVKDHPRSWGLRKPGYYRSLLTIPNVRIAPVEVPTSALIQGARGVAVLSSFVGLEAILSGKKVMTFGNNIFDCLSDGYTKKVRDLSDLGAVIQWLISKTEVDRDELRYFLEAVVMCSVDIDLYSQMLGKTGRLKGTAALEQQNNAYQRFADYTLQSLKEQLKGA